MYIRCCGLLLAVALLFLPLLSGQIIDSPDSDTSRFMTPVVDIVERRDMAARGPLAPPPVREADLLWEKRVWRVIDVREKMNQTFAYPERPFYTILAEAVQNGTVAAYTGDQFTTRLTASEIQNLSVRVDTIRRMDMCFGEPEPTVVYDVIAAESIQRYRILEHWYFDTQSGGPRVRILGLAPLREEYDEMGNLLFELPLYWVYYPELRPVLAREPAYAEGNDSARRSWDDLFESRFFSSYIYREDNVHDRRLRDYLTGRDLLLKADRIDREIFDFAGYLWSY